jgi:DNA polymerase-3 subunit epsilon
VSIRTATLGEGALAYRSAGLPGGRTHWREAGFCAVDLELTGLDPRREEIVSFGAVPIEAGRVVLGETVEGLVRPSTGLQTDSILVHGLRAADLLDAPLPALALQPLLGAMAGRIPVVHVAEVERSFLRRALRRLGVRLHPAMVDTSVLGAIWLSRRDRKTAGRQIGLSELAERLGLPVHREHRAGTDALTTAEVFLALASHLDAEGAETVRSLTTAERRLAAMRLYPEHPGV